MTRNNRYFYREVNLMNKRPPVFTIFSLLLTVVLLSSAAYILTSDFSLTHPQNVFLIGLFSGAGVLLSIAALGTWKPRPWGYLALTSTLALIAGLDIVSFLSTKIFTIYYVPDVVLVGSGIMILWDPKSRQLFFNASLRWWERAKRYALGKLIYVKSIDDSRNQIQVLDISESGCLLVSKSQYEVGDSLQIEVEPEFTISATVVRKGIDQFGVKFEYKSWREKRRLKKFIRSSEVASKNSQIPQKSSENFSKAA